MSIEGTPGGHIPIACNPKAIPAGKRDRWAEVGKQVYASAQEIQEMPDGYGFRLPPDSTMLLKMAEYMAYERLCCPFLHFTVEIESGEGPFWLRLTGGEGVKEYIWSLFETSNLLNEDIVKAAGLR